MKPRWSYLVEPIEGTYLNTQTIGGVDFVINTSIEDVKYVNRLGKIIESPKDLKYPKALQWFYTTMFSELTTT